MCRSPYQKEPLHRTARLTLLIIVSCAPTARLGFLESSIDAIQSLMQ